VRNAPALITFSEEMRKEASLLKSFLRQNLYRHYQVNRMTSKAKRIIKEMFEAFMQEPRLLPPDYQMPAEIRSEDRERLQARKVADYIAGMTDRYAMREHRRLFVIGEL